MKQFLLLIFATFAVAKEFQFLNRLPGEVWIGCLGGGGHPFLNGGGWRLRAGQRMSVQAPNNWEGRFWARTWCNTNSGRWCETGHCRNSVTCNGAGGEPPATLAEFKLGGFAGKDFYDVSLVDGFNVKMTIQPVGGRSDGGRYSCRRCACTHDINQDCPKKLQLRGSSGQVIGCKSACAAFNTDQYCCRGRHDKPHTCRSSDWAVNYPRFFKARCPDAYSYAYDDQKSTFTCNAQTYLITIG